MSALLRIGRASRTAIASALLAFGLLASGLEREAHADRRSETAAQDALKRADDDYLQSDFAKALRRLVAAERTCGEASCTNATHAALVRDIGTMQLRLAQADAATASFKRAKKLDPTITLNPDYDAKDLREAWDAAGAGSAAAAPTMASGDFTHRPAAAGAISTPLPVYVEVASAEVTSVVVKYKNDAMRSFRRAVLKRTGAGWGGYVPCADVVSGNLHYYVQGFDKDGELAATSGDPNHTFDVPVTAHVRGDAPSLPGEPAPRKCTEGDVQALNLDEGERCTEDRQCKSGTCASSGRCKAVLPFEQEEPGAGARGARQHARFWLGVSGSLDLTVPPSNNEVCLLNAGTSQSGYWCTTPEGKDFAASPQENAALVAGHRGSPSGELTPGGVHIMATFDYAATSNLLVGIRLGYVANAYPGDAASAAGKTIGPSIHAEVRGTLIFGDEPIARSGLAPYVFVAAGAARFDAPVTVMVAQQGVAGERAVRAWYVAGPAFGAAGGGARYAFSPRVAFATGIGIDAAVGPGAFGVTISPEMSLQYGF